MSSPLSAFSEEFSHRFRWDLFPIYICLAGIVMWLGALTLIFLAEHGVDAEQLDTLSKLTGLLALVIATSPFIGPAVAIGVERLR